MTTDLVLAGITEKRPCFTFCWKVFFGQSQLILNSPLFISDWGKMSRTFSLLVVWGVVDETLVENETRGLTKCAKLASWWCLCWDHTDTIIFPLINKFSKLKENSEYMKIAVPPALVASPVSSVAGHSVELPCDARPSIQGDQVGKEKKTKWQTEKRKDSPIIIAPLCCASILC